MLVIRKLKSIRVKHFNKQNDFTKFLGIYFTKYILYQLILVSRDN
jgi:hypothetical protein